MIAAERRHVVPLLLALFALTPARVQAAESAGVAEALFRDGVALFDAGRVHEACAKFAESYRLDPANGTLQNEALCHAREGKVASAWAEFALLAGRAAQAGQKAREQMARTQVAELEKRMAHVVLVFDRAGPRSPGEVEHVVVDGEELGRAAWTTPLPLDPGNHVVAFRATGKREATRAVAIPEGAVTLRVEVPALALAPEAEAPVSLPAAPAPAPREEPVATPGGDSTRRTIGVAGVGAGVALALFGTYFGLRTLSEKNDAEAHCNGRYCDADGLAHSDSAHTDATLSTIGFAAGLALAGAGAWLWLTSGPPDASSASSASATTVRLVPNVGAGQGGAALVGRF